MRKHSRRPFLLISLFTLLRLSTARDSIAPSQPLADGETLISDGGAFALGFFSPSNSTNRFVGIWYNNIKVQTVVWVANRRNPIPDSTGSLSVASDGSLAIAARNSSIIWSSAATNTVNPVVQLLNNGNLVVRAADGGGVAWQSFDYPTDTLLPGMKLGWDLTRGLSRNLTAWRSAADPAPGDYVIAMDLRGDPQLTVVMGSVRRWRSGAWNGIQFSGIPEMRNYSGFTFDFVDNSSAVYYTYGVVDPTIITRLMVNESGFVQRYIWVNASGSWSVFWFSPKTPCDSFSPCGPYGICDPSASPMCSCLQGFTPRSPAEWQLRDGSGGCVRRTALNCRNGTDGFLRVANAWPPDTVAATVDRSMISLDECRAACARNCSCTGYTSADVRGGGSGCIFWATDLVDIDLIANGRQELYVRLAGADLASTSIPGDSNKNKVIVAVVIAMVIFSAALLSILVVVYRWRKRVTLTRGARSVNDHWPEESSRGDQDLELPLFDLGIVMAATNNFAHGNKLGEGGFGSVYKGNISEGQEIAVKRLSKTSIQGIDEFKNEVTLIAKLQHRNLVRLLGCCIHAEERMLIYEYMHNKSLDLFLFDKANGVHLDWPTRYHIILGIARGLLYLHQDSRFRIIHRDLKASNILLDQEMNPKISDFGLARIFGSDEVATKTKRVVGTYGYMSPEYALDGIFSVKSDVFSFGVLVLEIVSGQRSKGVYLAEPNVHLLGNAWNLWSEGKSLELMDPAMGYSFSMTEVMRCIKVGLLCVQERPEDRPMMPSVVLMLSSDGVALPEPKQPGFIVRKDSSVTNSLSEKRESLTVNNVTITMSVGR